MAKLFIKDGVISPANRITIKKDGCQIFNPSEDLILEDGWALYEPEPVVIEDTPSQEAIIAEYIKTEINGRTDMDDATAKKYGVLILDWSERDDIKPGQIVSEDVDGVRTLYRALDGAFIMRPSDSDLFEPII